MQDAVAALEAAVDELRSAQESLPDDLRDQVEDVIEHAESVLEVVRAKTGA